MIFVMLFSVIQYIDYYAENLKGMIGTIQIYDRDGPNPPTVNIDSPNGSITASAPPIFYDIVTVIFTCGPGATVYRPDVKPGVWPPLAIFSDDGTYKVSAQCIDDQDRISLQSPETPFEIAIIPFNQHRVFYDKSGTGIYQSEYDLALTGVEVIAYNSTGTVLSRTLTDSNGQYSFAPIIVPDGQITIGIESENRNVFFAYNNTISPRRFSWQFIDTSSASLDDLVIDIPLYGFNFDQNETPLTVNWDDQAVLVNNQVFNAFNENLTPLNLVNGNKYLDITYNQISNWDDTTALVNSVYFNPKTLVGNNLEYDASL